MLLNSSTNVNFCQKNRFCEINVGICCACFPHLKPFLRKHVPGVMGSSTGGSGGYFSRSRKMRSRSYQLSSMGKDDGDGIESKSSKNKIKSATSNSNISDDNTSTEEILGQGSEDRKYQSSKSFNLNSSRQIKRTTEVDVQYDTESQR